VKASFLAAIAKGETSSPLVSKEAAVEMLGTMMGGYNVDPLVDALDDPAIASKAVEALSKTILMFDARHVVAEKMKAGNKFAEQVVKSWAEADWFTSRPKSQRSIRCVVSR